MIYLRALGSYSVAASQINLYRAEQRKKQKSDEKQRKRVAPELHEAEGVAAT